MTKIKTRYVRYGFKEGLMGSIAVMVIALLIVLKYAVTRSQIQYAVLGSAIIVEIFLRIYQLICKIVKTINIARTYSRS